MFEFPPPAERYELLPPRHQRLAAGRRALFHAVAAWVLLLLLLGSRAPDLLLGPGGLSTLLYSLGAAVAWGVVVFLSYKPITELPPIEISADGIRGPFATGGRRPVVPLHRIRIAHAWSQRGQARLVLGAEGAPATGFPVGTFADPRAPQRIAASIRRLVATLPRGAEQLAAMDRRAAVAERVQSAPIPATWGTAALLVLIHGLQLFTGSLLDPLNDFALGANSSHLVIGGEWQRLVTANLLHANPIHLGLNLWGLVLLGRLLEPLLGSWRWLTYFWLCCLAGSTASAFITRPWASLGASTGIAGLIGVYSVMIWSRSDDFPTAPSKLFWILLPAAFLVPALFFNVDHAGHAGGFVLGAALSAVALASSDLLELRRRRRPLMIAAGLILTALFLVAQARAVVYTVTTPADQRLSLYHETLGDPRTPALVANFAAWMIAIEPSASREQLETARDAMARAVDELDEAELRDTAATLAYRLGDFDAAIAEEAPLTAGTGPRGGFYRSQRARFELARARRDGARLELPPGAAAPQLTFYRETGTPGVRAALVAPDDLAGTAFVVRGALLRGDRLLGFVEARSGNWPAGLNLGEELTGELATATEIVLLAVERPPSPPSPTPAWSVEAMDPEAAALP